MADDKKEKASTRDQVFQAAGKMFRDGKGKEITARAIYDQIRYGSMGTINDALTEWWASIGGHVVQLEDMDGLPEPAITGLLEAFKAVQHAAQDQATEALVEYRKDADEKVEAAEKAREAVLEAKQVTDTTNADLKQQVEQLVSNIDALKGQLDQEKRQRLSAEDQAKQIQQSLTEAKAKAKSDQAILEKSIEALQGQLEREAELRDETETRLTSLYDQEHTGREKDRAEAEKTIEGLQDKVGRVDQALHEAEVGKAKLVGRLESASNEIQTLQEASGLMTDKYVETKSVLVSLQDSHSTLKQEYESVRKILTEAQETIQSQVKTIAEMEGRVAELKKTKARGRQGDSQP